MNTTNTTTVKTDILTSRFDEVWIEVGRNGTLEELEIMLNWQQSWCDETCIGGRGCPVCLEYRNELIEQRQMQRRQRIIDRFSIPGVEITEESSTYSISEGIVVVRSELGPWFPVTRTSLTTICGRRLILPARQRGRPLRHMAKTEDTPSRSPLPFLVDRCGTQSIWKKTCGRPRELRLRRWVKTNGMFGKSQWITLKPSCVRYPTDRELSEWNVSGRQK